MITVTIHINGTTGEMLFPKTKKGRAESIRFIQGLYDERKKHPWYYRLNEIKKIEVKLKDFRLSRNCKKRYQLESELLRENAVRTEHLQKHGITEAPAAIKISIVSE